MAYNLTPIKGKIVEISDWLVKEFSSVRTGKATPLLLDNVLVDNYGSKTPIKFIASISVEDAKTLRVTPWDKAMVKGIETAIAAANLGLSTAPDQTGIRVIFPDLTSERRQVLLKIINEKIEEARVSLRKEREKVWNDIQDKERVKEISEDDKYRLKEELQKFVDEGNADFESLVEKKKTEILG
ncbi:MAG: ribosome recycling factor [Candidatus Vogelbacteria bacterium]|nr:ribosome recycling factor [Candidatus Vogelbacteria bacterium]